jgi:hypothetical protein
MRRVTRRRIGVGGSKKTTTKEIRQRVSDKLLRQRTAKSSSIVYNTSNVMYYRQYDSDVIE